MVSCGQYHTVAVRSDGTLWAWGYNASGRLGDGTTTNRSSPVQIGTANNWATVSCGYSFTTAIRSDGTLWAWGANDYRQLGDPALSLSGATNPVRIGSESNWSKVSCGYLHSEAIRNDGTLWAWGYNVSGQLGDGSSLDRSSPLQIGSATWTSVVCGYRYTVAVRSDGTLWGWGDNSSGQLGDGTRTQRTSPVQSGSSTNWASVACGNTHTLAIKNDHTLWGSGWNQAGELGAGTNVQSYAGLVRIGSATNWNTVGCGSSHTMAINSNGTLWTTGDNSNGQLGNGTNTNLMNPVPIGPMNECIAAASGQFHAAAVKRDGTLWTWGYKSYAQLGDGTTSRSRSTPWRPHWSRRW